MNLLQRVFGILVSPVTLSLNFHFGGINGDLVRVSGAEFYQVAVLLSVGRIKLVEGTADPGTAIYTVRNDGNLAADTFYFGRNDYSSKSFEALVIHESVHAVYDLRRTVMPWIDNEAAAYIAQGYYATKAGVPDGGVDMKEYVFLGKLIANELIAGRPADELMLSDLRDKLRNDPTYAGYINTNFVGDGVL